MVKSVTLNRTLLLQKKDITTASIININRARITLGKGRRRIQSLIRAIMRLQTKRSTHAKSSRCTHTMQYRNTRPEIRCIRSSARF